MILLIWWCVCYDDNGEEHKDARTYTCIKSEPDSLSMSINHTDIGQTQLNTLYGILGTVSFKSVIK